MLVAVRMAALQDSKFILLDPLYHVKTQILGVIYFHCLSPRAKVKLMLHIFSSFFWCQVSSDNCFPDCGVACCAVCNKSITTCEECLPGFLLFSTNGADTCVTSCQTGYYEIAQKQACEGNVAAQVSHQSLVHVTGLPLTLTVCPTHCTKCTPAGHLTANCTSCDTGFGLFQADCICESLS